MCVINIDFYVYVIRVGTYYNIYVVQWELWIKNESMNRVTKQWKFVFEIQMAVFIAHSRYKVLICSSVCICNFIALCFMNMIWFAKFSSLFKKDLKS